MILVLLLISTLFSGLVGLAYGAVSYYFSIFPLFQIIVAVLIKLAASKTTKHLHQLAPKVIVVVLLSLFTYYMSLVLGFYLFKVDVKNALEEEIGQEVKNMTAEEAELFNIIIDEATDEFLYENTGLDGVYGFALYSAKTGTYFGRGGKRDITEAPVLGYLIEAAKLLVILIMPAYMVCKDERKDKSGKPDSSANQTSAEVESDGDVKNWIIE